MKILYGIQGTGNGHITRARAMAVELKKAGLDVDYLISGRPRDQLFDMDLFGDFEHREGLTFAVRHGRIEMFNTVRQSKPVRFLKDIKNLEFKRYDLVITDYEPITAWGGLVKKMPVVGLGHQYAFRHPIPHHHGNPATRAVMRYFAPASKSLGLHWHHFNQPILPPIAPVGGHQIGCDKNRIVVYLPFESPVAIQALLCEFPQHQFRVYHPEAEQARFSATADHIFWFKPSREAFQADLHRCEGVICNAGFELASETLQLGKKLLVKPVAGQTEQYSNAMALELLGYGHTMDELDKSKIEHWLGNAHSTRIYYPNVAQAICQWLKAGADEPIASLSSRLWNQTHFPDLTALTRDDNFSALAPPLSASGGSSHG